MCYTLASCLLSFLQYKRLICQTKSSGIVDPIQFEIIHEDNNDHLGIQECAHEFYMGEEDRRQERSMHKALWYSRSEDLSNLIFVCDIRYAIVIPPISQGKAPKWHDGIHLRNKEKYISIIALQRGKVKDELFLTTPFR